MGTSDYLTSTCAMSTIGASTPRAALLRTTECRTGKASPTNGAVVDYYMSLEEISSCCGRQVSVFEDERSIVTGLLERVALVSAPKAPTNGEGWRVVQLLVLVVDGKPYRVHFGAKVAVLPYRA